jgi:IS1 family transposase
VLDVAGHKAITLLESRVKNIEAKFVSVDEMYGFVHCLQATTTADDQLHGDQYAFLGVEQTTKLILHWHVGKRDKENALEFLRGLKGKTTGRFQLTSDGFAAYTGTLGGVWKVFRESVDYGFETKIFGCAKSTVRERIPRRLNPVVCLGVKRVSMIGKPKRSMMTTNHSERCNLSLRLFNRRFTRKTLGFSKKLRNHKLAVALQVTYFNFCRPHSALRIPATDEAPAKERTPAMAQGITTHVWRVEELLGG